MASSSRPTRKRVVDAAESCVAGVSKLYDVFLSHRGPDTKKSFAGFLYEGLKDAGLEPFFDIKGGIEKGEDSWESIENAIKKVPIALVIFSKNFTGSKWCLRELHLMLETPSVMVLPIFYKVTPSSLRHLEDGQLGVGFKKLQENGCGEEELESWRADLIKASTIDGWVIDDETMQADVVSDIVQRVCDMSNEYLERNVSRELGKVGVNQVAQQIIKTLDEKKNIMMLALWGMGGIGKTTLARELFYLLSKRYASSCHVKDVTEKVSMLDGVEGVQKHILESLCKGKEVKGIHHEENGRDLLEARLSNKSPFLLFLDDVSVEKEMMKYIITPEMLEGGSMCIVTTRDKGVLKQFGKEDGDEVYVHAMDTLSNEDSQRVFASYAFGGDCKVEKKFEALVESISMACGGVPLVMKVIGSCLNGIDDVGSWEEMKKKLERSGAISMDKAICNRLLRGYDTLSTDQQEMFLDIACGLVGEFKDSLERVWKSLDWCPSRNIPILVKRSLITVDVQGRLKLHDVLRDMGRSIEMGKKDEERARLWMPESLAKLEEKALPKYLQVLVITYPIRNDMGAFDVSQLKELRILLMMVLNDIVIVIPGNLRWFSQIVTLFLDGRVMQECLPEIPQDNKLVVLDFPDLGACPMCKQGHKPLCPVLGLGGLTALECLNLVRCGMMELPSLHQLTKLEKLNISHSLIKGVRGLDSMLALVEFDASKSRCLELPDMGKLTMLEKLNISNLDIKRVPGLDHMLALVEFGASKSRCLELPDMGKLTMLEKLNISDSCIEGVPGLDHMLALVEFDAYGCNILGLPDMGKLTRLRILHLPDNLSAIPGLSRIMPYLTNLMISGEALETLGVVCGNELQTLRISCSSAECGFPARISCPKLKSLNIWGCGSKNVDALLELNNLQTIELFNCDFEDVSCLNHLTSLRSIHMTRCKKLSQLPDLLKLTRLESLSIWNSPALTEWTLLGRSSLSGIALPSLELVSFYLPTIEDLKVKVEFMFPQLSLVEERYPMLLYRRWNRWSFEFETFL